MFLRQWNKKTEAVDKIIWGDCSQLFCALADESFVYTMCQDTC